MSLLNQLFGKYSLLAKEIYGEYLHDKEPISKEAVDKAVSQYERDKGAQITPYVEVLKRKILQKDFVPSEQYFQTRKFLREKWRQRELTKQANKANKKVFLKTTRALSRAIKDEIIADKIFIAQVRCFDLSLAYKKEYRRYIRLINDTDLITDFFAASPEEFHLFKIQKIKEIISAKGSISENYYKRIITQMLSFIKSIERR